jgi:hypothetical protein
MSTVVQPYVVNPQTGDLTVHGREGLYLELQFKNADGSASNVSAAAAVVKAGSYFEIEKIGESSETTFWQLVIV